uniref:apoptosis-stimulating of p53 protein 2-like isoform X2 n=1 Tax=Myxine glutinosa TaxID=7769 RepID=UPI00358DE232
MKPAKLEVHLAREDSRVATLPITEETTCSDVLGACRALGYHGSELVESKDEYDRVVSHQERMLSLTQCGGSRLHEVKFYLRTQNDTPGLNKDRPILKGATEPGSSSFSNGVPEPGMDPTRHDLQEMVHWQQQQIVTRQLLLSSREEHVALLQKEMKQRRRQKQAVRESRLQDLHETVAAQEAHLQRLRGFKSQIEHQQATNDVLALEVQQASALHAQRKRTLEIAMETVQQLKQQLEAVRQRIDHKNDLENDSKLAEAEQLRLKLRAGTERNSKQHAKLEQQQEVLAKLEHKVTLVDEALNEKGQEFQRHKDKAQQNNEAVSAAHHGTRHGQAGLHVYLAKPDTSAVYKTPTSPCKTITVPPNEGQVSKEPPALPRKPKHLVSSKLDIMLLNSRTRVTPKLQPFTTQATSNIAQYQQKGNLKSPSLNPPEFARSNGEKALNHLAEDSINVQEAEKVVRLDSNASFPSGLFPEVQDKSSGAPEISDSNKVSSDNVARATPTPVQSTKSNLPSLGSASAHAQNIKLRRQQLVVKALPIPSSGTFFSAHTLPLPPARNFQEAVRIRTQGSNGLIQVVYATPMVVPIKKPLIGTEKHETKVLHSNPEEKLHVNGMPGTGPSDDEGYEMPPPRPISPTKLLPFLGLSRTEISDTDLEALRQRLTNAPRPIKKRSSLTEPEGPNGPNLQRLLMQRFQDRQAVVNAAALLSSSSSASMEIEDVPRDSQESQQHVDEVAINDEMHPEATEDELLHESLLPPPPSSQDDHMVPEEEEISSNPYQLPDISVEESPSNGYANEEIFIPDPPRTPPPPYPASLEHEINCVPEIISSTPPIPLGKCSNLKNPSSVQLRVAKKVRFDAYALLLDASLEGDFDLLEQIFPLVDNPNQPNDDGITALHNAVCSGMQSTVLFLLQHGLDVNAADRDGWTPLHCAASINNAILCKALVEAGAAVLATTHSDRQTPADKCDPMAAGFQQCAQFMYGLQESLGLMSRGVVYALWDIDAQQEDDLDLHEGDRLSVLYRGMHGNDEKEEDAMEDFLNNGWWWVRCGKQEGYVPCNYLGLCPRIKTM